jgi:two-component system response regulator FixJ
MSPCDIGRDPVNPEINPLIFVIEDDEGVRNSTCTLLEALGYNARPFASAEALLEAPDAPAPACLVLDYNLPGMSGLDLIEQLRSRGARVPAVIVSANGRHLAPRAARAGVAAVLRKPLVADALAQWLEQILPRGK